MGGSPNHGDPALVVVALDYDGLLRLFGHAATPALLQQSNAVAIHARFARYQADRKTVCLRVEMYCSGSDSALSSS